MDYEEMRRAVRDEMAAQKASDDVSEDENNRHLRTQAIITVVGLVVMSVLWVFAVHPLLQRLGWAQPF